MKRHLSKTERHSLNSHISWREWGEKFGFKLYGSNDQRLGHFTLPDGEDFIVSKAARDAIDEYINKLKEQG